LRRRIAGSQRRNGRPDAAKFDDAVERATGVRPALPARIGDLFDREERYATLPGTFEAVTGYIAERAVAKA